MIDFNLDVDKGEFIAFLGPSGCGKTTTLRMIAGFEEHHSGDIFIRGKRINDLLPEQRPTSMIFQNYALFPHMSVRNNVGFGLDVKGMPAAERDRKVDRILDKLGLTDVADHAARPACPAASASASHWPARWSSNPIFSCSMNRSGALDANLRKSIQNELKLLQRSFGITFVFVTHAQSEALALSDRIVVMNQGRIEQISPPYELYTRPQSLFVAQFIGRNTIIPGTVKASSASETALDTRLRRPLGSVARKAGGTPAPRPVSCCPPSRSTSFRWPHTEGRDAARPMAHCSITGNITRLQQIGHLVQMAVTLPNGESIGIEGHADKYGGRFAAGDKARIAWKAAGATVILQ